MKVELNHATYNIPYVEPIRPSGLSSGVVLPRGLNVYDVTVFGWHDVVVMLM